MTTRVPSRLDSSRKSVIPSNPLFLVQIRYLLDELRLVDHVRKLRDHDLALAVWQVSIFVTALTRIFPRPVR